MTYFLRSIVAAMGSLLIVVCVGFMHLLLYPGASEEWLRIGRDILISGFLSYFYVKGVFAE